MRITPASLFGLALLAFNPLASADTFGVVPQVGLAGYGATVEWGFSKYLSLSAGYTWADQSVRDVKSDQATYSGDASLRNPQAFLRWAPFGGHFRLAAGLVKQNSHFDLMASQFTGTTAAPVDSITVHSDYAQSLAPALTFGWETPIDKLGLGYHFSAGAMYAGTPDVEATAKCKTSNPSGTPSAGEQAACDSYTADQRKQIEHDLERYKVLPILQAGLIYRM